MSGDAVPFRFNFVLDGGGDGDAVAHSAEGNASRIEAERSAEEAGEAEELRLDDSTATTSSVGADGFGLQQVGKATRLWKVVKLLSQSILVEGLDEATDLVPGRYEGGFKVWECSIDLCNYLVEKYNLEGAESESSAPSRGLVGMSVLELGCGQGLPGILCLAKGADRVVFQDFNREVLESVTHPCVLRNLREGEIATNGDVRYVSGDWGGCKALLGNHDFDLILTAETIYEPRSVPALLDLLAWCLKPQRGVVLVATKVYYFGVGGGVGPFEEAVRAQGLFHLEDAFSVDDGASNMRKVLLLRRNKVEL